MCLSVTMITKKIVDGFVSNFIGWFLGEKGIPSSCFVTIGRDVEVTVKKRCKRRLFFLHFILLVVGVASVGDKKAPNFTFVGSCTLSDYFPSS